MSDGSLDHVQGQRRLCIQNNMLLGIKEVRSTIAIASIVRSMLCTGKDHEYQVPISFNLMLLKVLDAVAIRLYEFPIEAVKLLLLGYLALTHHGKVPSSISSLQHLQFLIISQHHNAELLGNSTSQPRKFWGMHQLEHLRIKGHNLPNPRHGEELLNLSTLHVNARSCTEAVFRSIPNLKKLGIKIKLQPDATETSLNCFRHVGRLDKLESFKCAVVNPWLRSPVVPRLHFLWNLPDSLTNLSLNRLGYRWNYTIAFGKLSRLRVLKLRCSAFQGLEWNVHGCDFQNLEYMLLEDVDVAYWKIKEDYCFPNLQRLTIQHCFKLKAIPQLISSIRSLQTMEVIDCSPKLVASALRMRDEGRPSEVVIHSSWKH